MRKFSGSGWPHRRQAQARTVLWLFVGLSLTGISSAAAQSQSLAVNRALVSAGPAAAPPAAPASGTLGNVQAPAIPAFITDAVGNPQPLKVLSNKQGSFALVGVRPDQLVNVTVQYPVTRTAHLISAEALDGGQVLVQGPMLVGLDGSVRFQFRAAHSPGANHIALRDGRHELGLQFWVVDDQHPERNPPGLVMAN